MKKILVIAFAFGLFSATATFAQTSKSTSANAATATPAAKAEEAPAAKTGVATEAKEKDFNCGAKKTAGKSSCCMKGGKAEAKAETKEEKKAIEQ